MESFEFYRKIDRSNAKVEKAFSKLDSLYARLPKTKGCMENIKKEDGCGAWCCKLQVPQLFYVEFLYLWSKFLVKVDNDTLCDLIEKSMKGAIKGETTKGCIFHNEKTNLCDIHKFRPINCFFYGITPEDEFDLRLKRMKQIYKDNSDIVIMDQCNLVETVDGKPVTKKQINDWWQEIISIEKSIGIPEDKINDSIDGGSYRTPHDHLLLYLMPDNILMGLAGIEKYDDNADKIKVIDELMSRIRTFYRNQFL